MRIGGTRTPFDRWDVGNAHRRSLTAPQVLGKA